MADKKISDLPSASTPDGSEKVPLNQDKGGGTFETRKATLTQVYQWIKGKLGAAATKGLDTTSGDTNHLMGTGAYGLGGSMAQQTSDLYNVKSAGQLVYVSGASHQPSTANGAAYVVTSSSENYTSILYLNVDNELYTVAQKNGSWSSPRRTITSHDLATSTGTSTDFPMTQKATTDAINAAGGGGGGGQITEGTNSNGYWVKFSTGTALLYKHKFKLEHHSANWNLSNTWNLPLSLFSPNYILSGSMAGFQNTMTPDFGELLNPYSDSNTYHSADVHVNRINGGTSFKSGDYVYVDLMIIGRWKL